LAAPVKQARPRICDHNFGVTDASDRSTPARDTPTSTGNHSPTAASRLRFPSDREGSMVMFSRSQLYISAVLVAIFEIAVVVMRAAH